MCSDAWGGSRQAQSRPAGAVAFKEAGFTNPEIFRRGWESAGPPSPELPPKMNDGEGQNATLTAKQVNVREKYEKGAVLYTAESRSCYENPKRDNLKSKTS